MINHLLNTAPNGSGNGLFALEPTPATAQVPSATPLPADPFANLLIEIAPPVELDGEAVRPEQLAPHVHLTSPNDEDQPTPMALPLDHAAVTLPQTSMALSQPAMALSQPSVAPVVPTTVAAMPVRSALAADAARLTAVAGEPLVALALDTPAGSADARIALAQPRIDAAAMESSAAAVAAMPSTALPHSAAPQPTVPLAMTSRAQAAIATELLATSTSAATHAPMAQPIGALASERTPPAEAPVASARPNLVAALGERLHVQLARGVEHAVVRLDPPSLGSIEIVIRQEGGQLQVHLRASHAEVARQLQAIGETLRQDLVQRQHGEVSVQVWEREGDGRQRSRQPWQDVPGRALNEAGDEPDGAFALASE